MSKRIKVLYTEQEAARELGITVEELRQLVSRIAEGVPASLDTHQYQPADLILLRYLLTHRDM
jgi:hypothetical protein